MYTLQGVVGSRAEIGQELKVKVTVTAKGPRLGRRHSGEDCKKPAGKGIRRHGSFPHVQSRFLRGPRSRVLSGPLFLETESPAAASVLCLTVTPSYGKRASPLPNTEPQTARGCMRAPAFVLLCKNNS